MNDAAEESGGMSSFEVDGEMARIAVVAGVPYEAGSWLWALGMQAIGDEAINSIATRPG